MCKYEIEIIPDEDDLYRRISPHQYVENEDRISDGAFRGTNVSVDWSKYRNPQECIKDYQGKGYFVASIKAFVPRLRDFSLEHCPSHNRAHSEIKGKVKESDAHFFRENSKIVLRP